jgi:hypothetical protein
MASIWLIWSGVAEARMAPETARLTGPLPLAGRGVPASASFESFPVIVESRTINYHHPTIWESLKVIEMEFQTMKASKILCPKHQYGLTAVDDSHSFGVCRGAILWKFAGMIIIIIIMIMVVSKQIPVVESKDEQESLTLSSQMSRKVYSTQLRSKEKMR